MKTHIYQTIAILITILIVLLGVSGMGQAAPLAQGPPGPIQARGNSDQYEIKLKSRQFTPESGVEIGVQNIEGERGHVILQFDDIPIEADREILAANGIKLLDYLPNKAWFASVPADLHLTTLETAGLRWMGGIRPADKLSRSLAEEQPGSWAVEADGRIRLSVIYFEDVDPNEVTALIAQYGGEVIRILSEFNRYSVRLPEENITSLAAEDKIQWIEESPPPPEPENDGVRARTNVNIVQGAPYNLTGDGVRVGIWDGGQVGRSHPDFGSRVTIAENFWGVDDHATHVAGTLAGGGVVNPSYKGMAPSAWLYSYDFCGPAHTCAESDYPTLEVGSAINTFEISISQNSWGYPSLADDCNRYGDYNVGAREYDRIVTGVYGKPAVVVFSAGNERGKSICNNPTRGYETINLPKTGKNTIAVGATNSNDDSMTFFSSWGPVDDGRLKPDIVAPGCETGTGIESTIADLFIDLYNNFTGAYGADGLDDHSYPYDTMCGTSMAAPAVSGIAALLIQQYRLTNETAGQPLPSTIKALLIQGAQDLGNTGPDYQFGYGRVDAKASVDLVRDGHFREDAVGHHQEDVFILDVPAGTPSLKVTLAWDDPAAAVNANPAMVNDLSLFLVAPDGQWVRPWHLDPSNPASAAVKDWDNTNNVEQVEVSNPEAGEWEVHVYGWNVPQGPQAYSLAGGEFISSVYLPLILKNACTPPVLYFDDFSNPSSGWTVAEYPCCNFGYLDGEYQDLIKLAGWRGWPQSNRQFTDFVLEADGRLATSAVGAYGLTFGVSADFQQWYNFIVDSGFAKIQKYDNGTFTDLYDWTFSTAINTGTTPNHLKVIREGSRIDVYSNGTYLTTVYDSSFTGSRGVGVFARAYSGGDANVDARFDNYKVTALSCDAGGQSLDNSNLSGEPSLLPFDEAQDETPPSQTQ